MQEFIRHQEAKRITLIGAAANAFMAIGKIVIATIGHSHALLADGIHSLSDLLADGLVLLASHYGNQVADQNHPYGHRRIETAATVAVALLLMMAGISIIFDGINEMIHQNNVSPDRLVCFVALLSLCVNEVLFRMTLRVSRKIKSNLLKAHALHRRSDSLSALVVFLGVAVEWAGYINADEIAAMIVGVLIVRMGARLGWSSIQELVDTGLEPAALKKLHGIMLQVPGVRMVHQLRTRLMGEQIFVDVHVLVNPYVTVSEGHYIGEKLSADVRSQMEKVVDVTVHVDPEDDEINHEKTVNLPTRTEILAALNEHGSNLAGQEFWQDLRVHYLNGVVYIEIILPFQLARDLSTAKSLEAAYMEALKSVPALQNIRLLFDLRALPPPKKVEEPLFYGRSVK